MRTFRKRAYYKSLRCKYKTVNNGRSLFKLTIYKPNSIYKIGSSVPHDEVIFRHIKNTIAREKGMKPF